MCRQVGPGRGGRCCPAQGVPPPAATMGGPPGCLATGGGAAGQGDRSATRDLHVGKRRGKRSRLEQERRLAKRTGQTEAETARFVAQEESLKAQQEACRQERARLEAEDAIRREEFARQQQQWEAECAPNGKAGGMSCNKRRQSEPRRSKRNRKTSHADKRRGKRIAWNKSAAWQSGADRPRPKWRDSRPRNRA